MKFIENRTVKFTRDAPELVLSDEEGQFVQVTPKKDEEYRTTLKIAEQLEKAEYAKTLPEYKYICVHCQQKYAEKPAVCTPACARADFVSLSTWNYRREQEKKAGNQKITDVIADYMDYQHLALQFQEKQPVYYDKNQKWWLWNAECYKWELTDDTSIMVSLENALAKSSFTIKSQVKGEFLEALKRYGRRRAPKPIKETWVQFKNEIYDVKDGSHFEATPEYFVTNPLPWRVGDTEDTPNFDRLFREWVVGAGQDESWAETLYEIIAYSMLSCQPLQTLFALTGAGANGKGTFLSILHKFLGPDNIVSSEIKQLTSGRFETSCTFRKLVVMVSEASAREMQETNQIKKLSGEDKMRYEFKGKDPFSEFSYCTVIMATNSLPITPDKSEGWYRRWLIVDFPNKFTVGPNPVSSVPDAEFEALARKSIRKAAELLSNYKFTNAGTTQEKEKRYEERSNPVATYIKENYDDDIDAYVSRKDFQADLNFWLPKHNHRKLDSRQIGTFLRELGYTVKGRRFGNDQVAEAIFGIKRKQELFYHVE